MKICMFFELLRKMPHQNIRLDILLSHSGQDCVDFSPIDNYHFGWGPNFMESPSSLVLMFYDLQRRLHVVRMELWLKMPHQNISVKTV